MGKFKVMRGNAKRTLACLAILALLGTTIFSPWTERTVNAGSGTEVPPTDVVFDDLAQESISAAINGSADGNYTATKLGKAIGTDRGIRFKVTRPDNGQMKIGLYNTKDDSPWADGYVLLLQKGSKEGAVNWNVRSGANEGAWAAWGDELTDVSAEMEVYAWLSDVDGAKKLNVIIAGTRVITDGAAANGSSCGEVTQGTYMSVYNETNAVAVFTDLSETNAVPDTGVSFEDLAVTLGKNSITLASAGNDLGAVSSVQTGFRFRITKPTGGTMKVGLYNASANNVWDGGYLLKLEKGSIDGSVKWTLCGASEAVLTYGEVSGSAEEMLVSAWMSADKKLNLIVDGKQIVSSVGVVGVTEANKYMAIYNECSNTIIVKTINKEEDVPSADVIFDDLAQESIGAANNTATNLGKAVSTDRGFRFKVTRPDNGQMKIGLYNTAEGNPWANGYILLLTKGSKAGAVNWNVKSGANEDAWTVSGEEIEDVADEMEVYAWLSDADEAKKLNLIIAGTRVVTDGIATNGSCGEVTQGTYMSVYNETNTTASFTDLSETNAVPDTGVSFEDLAVALEKNSITLKANAGNDLGAVSSVQTGFRFRITKPTGGKMKVGLYNASANNVWDGGYLLILEKGSTDGSVKWTLCGAGEAVLTYGEVGGSAEEMLVSAWMSADKKLNLIIDGKQIVSSVGVVSVTEANRYMGIYNECSNTITVKTINKKEDAPSAGVIFDDLAQESIGAANNTATNLGKAVSTDRGFRFKVTRPDNGQMKIGLYNTSEGNPWANGYILLLTKGSKAGTVNWNVKSGASEDAWTVSGEEIEDVADEMEVYAWLSDVDGAEKLNVIIAGTRVVTDGIATNGSCGEVTQGTYMSVYNETNAVAVFTDLSETNAVPDTGVSFEDLAVTLGKNSITLASAGNDLGAVSSVQTGVRFRITKPTGGTMKVGLYNASANNVWDGGYLLKLEKGSADGSVKWTLCGAGEAVLTYGEVSGSAEEMLVSAWMSADKKLNLIIDGKQIVSSVGAVSVTDANKYMAIYNECSNTIMVETINKAYSDFIIQKINSQSNYDSAAGAWKIYLNTDVNISGKANTSYKGSIQINGTEYSDVTFTKVSEEAGNLICMVIPADKIPATPERDYEVVISAQQMEGGTYSIRLTAGYTLYVRTDGRVLNVTWPYAEDSDVLGDCNGDGVTNAKDLVRLKKYLEGQALVNNQADLTPSDGENIGEKDVRVLRKILLGLNVTEATYVASGEPFYDEQNEMRIGAYMGPRSSGKNDYSVTYKSTSKFPYTYKNDIASVTARKVDTSFLNAAEFQQFADAGFNTVIAEYDAAYGLGNDNSATKDYLTLAKNAGVDVIMWANSVEDYLRGTSLARSEAEVKQEISAMMSDLRSYENFVGIQMADEITADTLERRAGISGFVKNTLGYDDKLMYTNLAYYKGDTLTTLMQKVGVPDGIYQFDFYPFWKTREKKLFSSSDKWVNDFRQTEWFDYLSSAATAARDNNVPQLGMTLQSCGYEHPVSMTEASRRDISSKADIGFQVYTGLAYGVKTFTYFTYWEHYNQSANEYFTSALVRYPRNGEDSTKSVKTAAYNYVKAVNDELKKFDHVLLDYEWKGTINVGSVSGVDSSYTADQNSRISTITDTTGQAVIGCMKDSEGFDGYMIANASNPENGTNTSGRIVFNNATRAIVYDKGERSEVQLENGAYTWNVESGEGVFIIPLVK